MIEKSPTNKLPPLAFGERDIPEGTDIREFCDRMKTVISSLNYYDPIGDSAAFRHKSCVATINGMKLIACAHTPVLVDAGDTRNITLKIPCFGGCISTIEGRHYRWSPSEGAMFIPAMARSGHSSIRSMVVIDLDITRLQETTRAMLGLSDNDIDLGLHIARVLPMQTDGIGFAEAFRHLCQLIDTFHGETTTLEFLGIDDMLYRYIIMMLNPLRFGLTGLSKQVNFGRRSIDAACGYMQSCLDSRVTLTDLERISGLSARSLQYAFQTRFGCTPMQWLRQQRLMAAQNKLAAPQQGDTVTSIAFSCGYTSLSAFAADYRKEFGKLPSATLAGSIRQ